MPIPLRELAMPDPPSGLPFNAKPRSSDLRAFLKKYQNLPALNASLPNDYPELVEDYKKVFILKNLLKEHFIVNMSCR